jgi:DNA-binding CsgD family transcriptional regulator
LGELERAAALCERLEGRGRAVDRPWALATAARCRGLIAAARRDLEAAIRESERALAEHSRLPVPFERARTLLALGQVQRRAKRKRAAREALEAARAVFEELGAPLWIERARGELARIGGRPASGSELTPSEARIAALVAEGRTNKEAAAELFVTVNTVETTLRHVYAKLGVRSRAELARRFAVR